MKLSDKYDKFIDFICDEFQNNEDFRQNGEAGSTLVTMFQRATNIRFVDVGQEDERLKQAAIKYLFDQSWIEPYSIDNKPSKVIFDYNNRFKPTDKGIAYVEDRRKSSFKIICRNLYLSIVSTFARVFTRK